MRKILKLAFLFVLSAIATHAQANYQTAFPATENPISEGGNWNNGQAQGLDWTNVQTTPGKAFGTAVNGNPPFNDSLAVLSGAWPSDQAACVTLFIDPTLVRNSSIYETEIRLRSTLSSHNNTGYEFNYSMFNNGSQYMQVVRLNGALNSFTVLGGSSGVPIAAANGDVFCASAVGSTLKSWLTRNSAVIQTTSGTITDSTYTGGSPGIGFFNLGSVSDESKFGVSFFQADKYMAATCNKADVAAVINGPIHTAFDGDVVGVPSGACTWTGAGGVAVAANVGIQIIGAGQTVLSAGATTCPAPGNSTCILDQLTSGTMFALNPHFGNATSRISGMTPIPAQPKTGYDSFASVMGTCTTAGCPNLRLDHLTVSTWWAGSGISDDSFAVIFNVFGVADHNLIGDSSRIGGGNGVDFINVAHGQWQGIGNYGDNSWASADTFGTFQTFYLEDNTFTNAFGTDSDRAGAAGGGARFACRFNTFNGITGAGTCTGHGTDTTGRTRGVRQWEGYWNTGTCMSTSIGCGSAWPGRSGVGISAANTFSNVAGGFMTGLANLDPQRRWRPDVPWGGCSGLSPWDTNDGVTYFSGTAGAVTLASQNYTINDSGSPGWTTNQWSPLGSPYSFFDVTQGFPYEIGSSAAASVTTQTTGSNLGPPAVNVPAAGNAYQILRATVCMDQPTRSGGNLVTGPSNGLTPVLASTGNPGPVSQALDPTYEADDVLPSTAVGHATIGSNTRSIIDNRDKFVESVNQAANNSCGGVSCTPFNGTSGSGHGLLANRPNCSSGPTCTVNVGYWATDQGTWDLSGGGHKGQLYTWNGSAWTLKFTPACYPHPLIPNSPCAGATGAPIANLSPSSLPFGSVLVGSTSAAQNITLSNTGTATLNITSIAVGGANAADFSQTNTCGAAVFVGGSCVIAVKFTPFSAASFSANITVTDNASGSPHTAALTGTGTTATAGIGFAPTSLTFSGQTVGTSSAPQTVTVTNTGSGNLIVSGVAPSGGAFTSFSQTNSCTTVAPSATCPINVTFTPQSAGALASQVCVTDNAPASPQCFNISGTGNTTGNLNFAPAALTFPNTAVGVTSTAILFTATNSGGSPITISSIAVTGTNASNFAQTNNCATGLAAGGSCTVSVKFTPSANGSRTAAVTFTDTAPASPQSVSLQGVGFTPAPQVTLSVASVTFGNQTTGTASNPQVAILTNTGTATLNISATSITGANMGDFGDSGTCGSTLAPNASCTYPFVFTPTGAGSRTATFNLTTNAPSSVDHISLSGTGVSSPNGAPAPQVFGE